jgi:hypothetical protein
VEDHGHHEAAVEDEVLLGHSAGLPGRSCRIIAALKRS